LKYVPNLICAEVINVKVLEMDMGVMEIMIAFFQTITSAATVIVA
jgi:hypothetical protein